MNHRDIELQTFPSQVTTANYATYTTVKELMMHFPWLRLNENNLNWRFCLFNVSPHLRQEWSEPWLMATQIFLEHWISSFNFVSADVI